MWNRAKSSRRGHLDRNVNMEAEGFYRCSSPSTTPEEKILLQSVHESASQTSGTPEPLSNTTQTSVLLHILVEHKDLRVTLDKGITWRPGCKCGATLIPDGAFVDQGSAEYLWAIHVGELIEQCMKPTASYSIDENGRVTLSGSIVPAASQYNFSMTQPMSQSDYQTVLGRLKEAQRSSLSVLVDEEPTNIPIPVTGSSEVREMIIQLGIDDMKQPSISTTTPPCVRSTGRSHRSAKT